MSASISEKSLMGALICRGIAIGRPYFLKNVEETVPEFCIAAKDIDKEITRFQNALAKALEDTKILQIKMQNERILEGAAIFEAHLQIMQDPLITTNVEQKIRETGKNAEFVFQHLVLEYQNKFKSITDPFFRERFKDIQDISRRVINHLRAGSRSSLTSLPPDSIIFAEDLSAFDTAEANSSCVAAFVTQTGGATSHAAIVARAKGIPYVSNILLDHFVDSPDALVIVDGRAGEIIINPSEATLIKYKKLRDQLHQHQHNVKQLGKLEAETFDGYKILLSANVETLSELELLHQYGGHGVGLLRTESAFLSHDVIPTEEEQFILYRDFAEKMKGLPIVIRAFDWGGDKYLNGQHSQREVNPFLGCRAIRFLLREKLIFKAQLRAIIRASAFGDVRIMFPLISSLFELREAKALVYEARRELISEGVAVASHIPLGCMIEVPSAALITDLLAKECDFLSIGTNDLVQYSLAVDRGNHVLSDLYTPAHPGVIRLIRMVVNEANHYNTPVAICGEIAGDPRYVPLLLGLGIRELSVASLNIPTIKNVIRNTSIVAASKLAEQALALSCPSEIQALISKEYSLNVPEDCFYNC